MSSKCFITFLNTTAQTERSDSNPWLQPRCLHASHPSFLRRKVASRFRWTCRTLRFRSGQTRSRGLPVQVFRGPPLPVRLAEENKAKEKRRTLSSSSPRKHAGPGAASDQPVVPEPSFSERARTLVYLGRIGSLSTVSRS